MDNSKPPGGSGKASPDIKSEEKRTDDKPEKTDQEINTFTGYTLNLIKRLKEQSKEIFEADDVTQSELTKQLCSVQKKIEDLFDKVLRQVLNFLSKDVEKLKNHTKEEQENSKKVLSEYKTMMEKILAEHMENVDNIRMKLHTGIISQEEIEQYISLFDEKMLEIMKKTDKMFEMLKKSEFDTLKKNLRKVLEPCIDDIENSNDSFIEGLEKMAENSSKTTSVQKPSIPQIKLPKISKIFAPNRRSNDSQYRNNNLKQPSPFSSMAGKLQSFSIKKFFDSETNRGRANAAKVTYLGVLIGFIYWKWRSSKS